MRARQLRWTILGHMWCHRKNKTAAERMIFIPFFMQYGLLGSRENKLISWFLHFIDFIDFQVISESEGDFKRFHVISIRENQCLYISQKSIETTGNSQK